jgi:hypothetical protein
VEAEAPHLKPGLVNLHNEIRGICGPGAKFVGQVNHRVFRAHPNTHKYVTAWGTARELGYFFRVVDDEPPDTSFIGLDELTFFVDGLRVK